MERRQVNKPSAIEKIAMAVAKLRKLGAKDTVHTNGAKAIYLPGDVNVRNIMDVKTYGMYVAANKRTHKHYLRHNKK